MRYEPAGLYIHVLAHRSNSYFCYIILPVTPLGGICSKHPLFSVSLLLANTHFSVSRGYTMDTRLFPPCMCRPTQRVLCNTFAWWPTAKRYPPFSPRYALLALSFFPLSISLFPFRSPNVKHRSLFQACFAEFDRRHTRVSYETRVWPAARC